MKIQLLNCMKMTKNESLFHCFVTSQRCVRIFEMASGGTMPLHPRLYGKVKDSSHSSQFLSEEEPCPL